MDTPTETEERQDELSPPNGDPTAGAGAPPADDEPTGPEPPTTAVKAPRQTNGTYMILWANKPGRGEGRPAYTEIGYYEASGPDAAKRKAGADPDNDWLRRLLEEGRILLRAVAAQQWPHKVDWSGRRPDPRVQIR